MTKGKRVYAHKTGFRQPLYERKRKRRAHGIVCRHSGIGSEGLIPEDHKREIVQLLFAQPCFERIAHLLCTV